MPQVACEGARCGSQATEYRWFKLAHSLLTGGSPVCATVGGTGWLSQACGGRSCKETEQALERGEVQLLKT